MISWQYTTRGRLSKTIEQVNRPIPVAEDGQVVVRIMAAALNPVENQIAQSSDRLLKFIKAPPMGTPFVPCWDFSGVIYAAGEGVEYKVGDEVFGVIQNMTGGLRVLSKSDIGNGSLQEYVAIPASSPFTYKPKSLSWNQAAALPLAYGTVFTALINYGRLAFTPHPADSGRSVLILGGSSGTGTIGIQLAKKMGLKVVTTCSTRNIDLVKQLGADEVIDYTTEHVSERALLSVYAPYAVVLDCVGGTELLPHLDNLILHDPKAPQLGIYVTIVGDKTSRDAMGGATTNVSRQAQGALIKQYYYPSQVIRQLRGSLQDVSWCPPVLAGKRYACIMFAPTKPMYDTIGAFMQSAKEVQIDSVHPFNVSLKFSLADVECTTSFRTAGKRKGPGQGCR